MRIVFLSVYKSTSSCAAKHQLYLMCVAIWDTAHNLVKPEIEEKGIGNGAVHVMLLH